MITAIYNHNCLLAGETHDVVYAWLRSSSINQWRSPKVDKPPNIFKIIILHLWFPFSGLCSIGRYSRTWTTSRPFRRRIQELGPWCSLCRGQSDSAKGRSGCGRVSSNHSSQFLHFINYESSLSSFLYTLMADPALSSTPFLILANKQDETMAKGAGVIKSLLEKEM